MDYFFEWIGICFATLVFLFLLSLGIVFILDKTDVVESNNDKSLTENQVIISGNKYECTLIKE